MNDDDFKKLLNSTAIASPSFIASVESECYIPVEDKKTYLPRLNIGSGPNVFPFEGWINYDREDISNYLKYLDWQDEAKTLFYVLHEMPEHQQVLSTFIRSKGMVDFRVHDIRNGFSHHADNSIESIYIGQVIEHLNPIHEVPKLLKDCHRMLKPGGVIRMTTPDLDLLIKAYLNDDMDKFAIEQPEFYRNADPGSQLAMIMYGACGKGCTWTNYDGHMFLFTKKSMTAVLSAAGFKDVEFYYETGKSKDDIMSKQVVDFGLTHSFVVEAIK
jgi:SAM-dependent methyltransferase